MQEQLKIGFTKITYLLYQKKTTLPNLPQARPIEDFWTLLSRRLYDEKWQAQNEKQLRRRIFRKICEIDVVAVQDLISNVRRKLS
ncbi:unnamed protein product [Psylliodes chrysocephalus]|uniref:Uncharacterized protein n=1 Tax=Psylliodes chrysocephalus TaxID=3402493 RepID=A0A9P0D5Y0_9CUCU|nr:unnamed protein product [Psylliodes chrysocephala]